MVVVKSVSKRFGGLQALSDVSLDIPERQITGLIGPNGAGKTTLFNTIAGFYKPDCGSIYLQGNDITGLKPHQLFAKGILRTFQIAHEFSSMTVLENLMVVPPQQVGESILNSCLQRGKIKDQEKQIQEKALEVIDFLKMNHLCNEQAGNLSGGQKKLLELGRTMMVDAKIVLLDEIGAGVNPTLLLAIGEAIVRLKEEKNYTFFLIEHDIDFIAKLCDSIVVMIDGKFFKQGSISEILADEEVVDAYLGQGGKK